MNAFVFYHRREHDGRYIALVHTDRTKWINSAGDPIVIENDEDLPVGTRPHPGFVRRFEWGPLPIVPNSLTLDPTQLADAEARYRRTLEPGKPFVSEDEYLYLQACEIQEVIAEERQRAREPDQLEASAEGMTI